MSCIYICYRRTEVPHAVGRICDRLEASFPLDQIFRDLDQIHPGENFREVIREAIGRLGVALIVMGPKWADLASPNGTRRLDNPEDVVRFEIELALANASACVIPVLVDGAEMPSPERMPVSLRALCGLHAFDLEAGRGFKRNMDSIVGRISQIFQGKEPQPPRSCTFQERLADFGANADEEFRNQGVLDLLESKFAIGDVLVDAEFAAYREVPQSHLEIGPAAVGHPRLPEYVYDVRNRTPQPEPNHQKAYLEDWSAPIIDRGERATLNVGHLDPRVPSGFYDYWTSLAVLQCIPRIQAQLLSGEVVLREIARKLDVVLVVVTADRQLVLARRSHSVDSAKGHWMASVGESVDPSLDSDSNGAPNPLRTSRRCLGEFDELNLPAADVAGARLQTLGIATEWNYLIANLIVLVELNLEFARVKERISEAEHTHIDGLSFTPEACLPIIRDGFYRGRNARLAGPLVPVSRVALLMSLMNKFGRDDIDARIG